MNRFKNDKLFTDSKMIYRCKKLFTNEKPIYQFNSISLIKPLFSNLKTNQIHLTPDPDALLTIYS